MATIILCTSKPLFTIAQRGIKQNSVGSKAIKVQRKNKYSFNLSLRFSLDVVGG
jgi:hypothetical protein